MNLRKSLIQLANKLEIAWQKVDFSTRPINLQAGWYVTEFLVQGSIRNTPRMMVRDADDNVVERSLIGFHSGRNRMLIYLPAGTLEAYSDSVEFTKLGRVSWLEGRSRILLICFRYLIDFFSIKVFAKMILMQFQKSSELSTQLLHFYSPEPTSYLRNLNYWTRFRGFEKQLTWWCRGPRIAVLIEHESQRQGLDDALVKADLVMCVDDTTVLPNDIDYVIALSRTEYLREASLLVLKRALKNNHDKPRLIYSDHDYASEYDNDDVQSDLLPVFKPQPSHCYLHCFNYVGPAVIFSRAALEQAPLHTLFDDQVRYQLVLECFTNTDKVLHISEALFCSQRQEAMNTPEPTSTQSAWSNIEWQRQGHINALIASPAWTQTPSVDLIIPTRDALNVLKPCVESLLTLTDYSNFHITIVDNNSADPQTHAYFEEIKQDQRVSVLSYPGEFNYSAINNYAVAQSRADYIALVNNDIEVIHADWLRHMMVWVSQDNVGVVGAKLLFSNDLIQHAGVIIGMGNAAGHIHRLEPGDSPGYQQRCMATQNMMAVTAACMITPRNLFTELGGLDEHALKVAYNDIDYCLRVEQAGYELVWTPQARLYHHESVSRGDDMSDEHIARYLQELGVFQKRWRSKGFVDKYYSRHLRISDEGVYPQISRAETDTLVYL